MNFVLLALCIAVLSGCGRPKLSLEQAQEIISRSSLFSPSKNVPLTFNGDETKPLVACGEKEGLWSVTRIPRNLIGNRLANDIAKYFGPMATLTAKGKASIEDYSAQVVPVPSATAPSPLVLIVLRSLQRVSGGVTKVTDGAGPNITKLADFTWQYRFPDDIKSCIPLPRPEKAKATLQYNDGGWRLVMIDSESSGRFQ